MKIRRTKKEIIADILEAIDNKTNRISAIMRYVNLSTAVARKYLKILMENGLIEEKNGEYLLTEKGKQALALLREERKLELELALLINDLEKIFF